MSVIIEGEDEDSSPSESESQRFVEPTHQACCYLSEMFSNSLLRSHATISLVDRDRLQLYHANRSVILVSSATNFSYGDGLDKFIATIMAFQRLSLDQNRAPERFTEPDSKPEVRREGRVVQKGNELRFSENEKCEPFKVKLAAALSRDLAIVGRSTAVFNATSDRWPKTKLVVKISWPTSGQISETDFLKKATGMAEGDHAWAANHLPRVYFMDDVDFHSDSTLESVSRLFENANFVDRGYKYQRRTLRIIIQERLYPLESLTNVRDIGQVFLDVACGTSTPFRFSITVHSPWFSSSLALRSPWDPPPRPQFQQYHVAFRQGDEH